MSGGVEKKAVNFSGWLREPFVRFFLAGALLVMAHRIHGMLARPEIRITREWVEVMARDYELRAGHPPSKEDRAKLVDEYVKDEILYREAIKVGKVEDPRVRRLLALTMREELEPVLGDPSDEELQKFREGDAAAWKTPASVSFLHASFAEGEEVPEDMLERLKAGSVPVVSAKVGMANPLPMTWMPQIGKRLGEEFAKAVVEAPAGEWIGPLKSKRGVHFVKLLDLRPAGMLPFSDVRPALVSEWMEERKFEEVAEKVAGLRKKYRIELPAGADVP